MRLFCKHTSSSSLYRVSKSKYELAFYKHIQIYPLRYFPCHVILQIFLPFLVKTLLRYNSHAIQLPHLKTIQWFLVYSWSYAAVTIICFRTFSWPQKETLNSLAVTLPKLPSLGFQFWKILEPAKQLLSLYPHCCSIKGQFSPTFPVLSEYFISINLVGKKNLLLWSAYIESWMVPTICSRICRLLHLCTALWTCCKYKHCCHCFILTPFTAAGCMGQRLWS